MIACDQFYNLLTSEGIRFFTGVPDSLLKNICAYITDHTNETDHIITPNEGNAMALASGYHLATGSIPLVYMQNSGFGNCVNPLTSLTDSDVYQIPQVLLIGWRGEPDVNDEPQHVKMGRINPVLLEVLGIPYEILSPETTDVASVIKAVIQKAKETSAPVALLVKKDTFSPYTLQTKMPPSNLDEATLMSRESAIVDVLKALPPEAKVVSTTGKISREIYEYRHQNKLGHDKDFLTVGAMGHTSHIALGVALAETKKGTNRPVVCVDGDGAALMHMGAFATAGCYGTANFFHVILNNAAHESVGGQPTMGRRADLKAVASACEYHSVFSATTQDELTKILPEFLSSTGPVLLEVQVALGSRSDLMRPLTTPVENKRVFMADLCVNTTSTDSAKRSVPVSG